MFLPLQTWAGGGGGGEFGNTITGKTENINREGGTSFEYAYFMRLSLNLLL